MSLPFEGVQFVNIVVLQHAVDIDHHRNGYGRLSGGDSYGEQGKHVALDARLAETVEGGKVDVGSIPAPSITADNIRK